MDWLHSWITRIKPTRIVAIGFALVIFAGALALMLPCASRAGGSASMGDALFTATSAVCVTGLVVQDTASHWSGFGQAVILVLIQIGGLGVVMLAVTIARLSGRAVGMRAKGMLQDSVGAMELSNIVRLSSGIVRAVFCAELLGAAAMLPVFARDFGLLRGIWYSVFHSVSAFCNAGFDLMGSSRPFSSLTAYADNGIICITVMALIAAGGLGFLTWEDLLQRRWHWRQYRLQTKVILTVTLVLILVPAVMFYFLEFQQDAWKGMGTEQKWLAAFFQSVTPRTAGFNTVDYSAFSESGQMLTILLMLIGGAPGSTAGGMKVTTIAVVLAASGSLFLGQEDTGLFHRRIPSQVLRQAMVICLMYLAVPTAGAMAISLTEDIPLLTALFETASAMGTVGLTLGITPMLHTSSRVLLMVLMYLGRVGGLSLMFAVFSKAKQSARYPAEKITVG